MFCFSFCINSYVYQSAPFSLMIFHVDVHPNCISVNQHFVIIFKFTDLCLLRYQLCFFSSVVALYLMGYLISLRLWFSISLDYTAKSLGLSLVSRPMFFQILAHRPPILEVLFQEIWDQAQEAVFLICNSHVF